MKRDLPWGLFFALMAVGCHSTGIKVAPADGGVADRAGSIPDATTSDTVDALVSPEAPDAVAADSRATDAAKELGPDSVVGPEVAADARPDVLLASDPIPNADRYAEVTAPWLPEVADAKVLGAEVLFDVQPDLPKDVLVNPVVDDAGTDAPQLPKDVTVYASKDYGPADAQCVAATPGWLSQVATFLAEDQKCWADSDCTYVSFSDNCGSICVLPMNQQRIGEFGTRVYGYASSNCSTCPSAPSYPACAPPTAVYCNAGRCEYKRS
jgi:hypothetical protein